MLRVSKLQDKWRTKLRVAMESNHVKGFGNYGRKYAMFVLPFITVLREGLEAVVFVGGIGVGSPPSAFPIPVITGILAGSLIGFIIYHGGNIVKLQYFLVASTCLLYLVAAGLLSKSAWFFDMYHVRLSP